MGDQRVFANPLIGLAQPHAVLLGQPHQPLARAMHQFGVGRERHGLGLNRGVDDRPWKKSEGFAAPVRVATFRLS